LFIVLVLLKGVVIEMTSQVPLRQGAVNIICSMLQRSVQKFNALRAFKSSNAATQRSSIAMQHA
jgi:hypothetical protein